MPLILKAAGERIYCRGGQGQALTQVYGLQDWLYVKDRADNANTFTFSFSEPCLDDGTRWIPSQRDEIFIYKSEDDYDNDVRWFGGILTEFTDTMIHRDGSFVAGYRMSAHSFDIVLDKELRQPLKAGLSWENLLKYLLTNHFGTQLSTDYTHISNTAAAPPVKIVNNSLRVLLRNMRKLTGHDFYVDAYKKLHVFRSQDVLGSFTLDDQPLSGMTVWDKRPTVNRESRAVYNIVRQPFQFHIGKDDWDGETFTAKGDPKGQGGQIPLLRTPATIEESVYFQDKFDGAIDTSLWVETDVNTTQHPDYPNQGYMFSALGQLQLVGGTGTLGGVALVSADFQEVRESAYIIQEFQLTNATGEGYIAAFTDGTGLTLGAIEGGLHVLNGALKALDGTMLVASLDLTANYLIWATITADGFQYDIQGGAYATKTRLHTETGVTHATDYKVSPVISKSLHCSINSIRYKSNDRNLVLEINGETKVVGLEQADTDLPDIDAFLNVDETPALIKFKAAEALSFIASVSSNTSITVTTGQGIKFKAGHRLLIGDNIVEAFDGREAVVASVAGDVVTLKSPGLSGMSMGQGILINTTVPAKDDKIVVKYGYIKQDEAVASDQNSIDKYGNYPITLAEKDHIKRFDDAQLEAENFLEKYKDGLLKISFKSNSKLMPVEPQAMTSIPVSLNLRPDPINKQLALQRVEVRGLGLDQYAYELELESADPTTPLDDLVVGRALIVGTDGAIRFSVVETEKEVSDVEDLNIRSTASLDILWSNLGNKKYGEFKWKP